ncbi:MAG: DUF3516 domain-containing protein, partial [Vicinamibacterales bacterium]
ARDFHQIAGRAGRKGFDDRGYVVAQAPEYVIENLRLAEKAARDGKKVVKRKRPEHNFVDWDVQTFTRLMNAQPEQLVSRFQISHGMLLNVLSRPTDGCRAMQRLIRDSHEPEPAKAAHRQRAWQLFRALVARQIVEFIPRTPEGAKLRVNIDLQDDFSMDQTLSLYLLETLPRLEMESPTYALDVLTLAESILEDPDLILRRQLDRLKDRAIAQMKADGMEYEQRMAELEKLEYPKPLREFIYDTFNAFANQHPWVGEENIRPKSIAREMFEQYQSFAEYVREYELQRSEGLLLRHLNGVYKVLSQTVPDAVKTDEVREMELYLGTLLRAVDSSLADEWARMRDPGYVPLGGRTGPDAMGRRPPRADEAADDIVADTKAFLAAIRTRVFTFLRAWWRGDAGSSLETLRVAETHPDGVDAVAAESSGFGPEGGVNADWTVKRLEDALEEYRREHADLRFDPEARNLRHTHVTPGPDGERWEVQQVLVDAEGHNDWMAEFEVDLAASRRAGAPALSLVALGPIGEPSRT